MTISSFFAALLRPDNPGQRGHWLPAWARVTHPVVARRMKALPAIGCFAGRFTRRRLLGVVLILLAPCTLLTGTLPLQVVLLPLSWLPLVWAAALISQERRVGAWDLLRLTPLSAAELLLANGAGIAYGLWRVLRWLIIGQAVCVLNVLLSIVLMLGSGGYRTLTGSYVYLVEVPPPAGALPAFVVIALLSLAAVPLEFGLSIGLGLLASALVARRDAALVLAAALRIAASLMMLAAGVTVLVALLRRSSAPLMMFGSLLVAGPFGWPLVGILQAPGAMLAITLTMVVCGVLLLGATCGALCRAARRL